MNVNQDSLNIKQSRLASNAAIKRKDVAVVSSYWLPNFVQIAGDGSHSMGRDKIAKDWKRMFLNSSPVFERIPEEILIAESEISLGKREIGCTIMKSTLDHTPRCGVKLMAYG